MHVAKRIMTWLISIPVVMCCGEPFFWLIGRRRSSKTVPFTQIKRLLIVRLDEIGDMTLSTGFLRELRRNLPSAYITLVVKPKAFNVVRRCPYVNNVMVYDCPSSQPFGSIIRHWRAFIFSMRHLLRKNFDTAIVPTWDYDLFYASFIAYFSGAPVRIAYSEHTTPHKQIINKGYDRLFTNIICDVELKHEVERHMNIIKYLGGKIESDRLELWLDDESSHYAAAFMRENNVASQDLLIAMAVGSRDSSRMLSVERLCVLAQRVIQDFNARLIFFGDTHEAPFAADIERTLSNAGTSRVLNLTGKSTLTQTCACMKYCRLYIGFDTGLTHIAAALGLPIVELSAWPKTGAINSVHSPYRFHPWRVPHIVLVPERPISPCSEECVSTESHCILQIGTDEVINAARKLLSNPDVFSQNQQ